jgi:hypothetical protein
MDDLLVDDFLPLGDLARGDLRTAWLVLSGATTPSAKPVRRGDLRVADDASAFVGRSLRAGGLDMPLC